MSFERSSFLDCSVRSDLDGVTDTQNGIDQSSVNVPANKQYIHASESDDMIHDNDSDTAYNAKANSTAEVTLYMIS